METEIPNKFKVTCSECGFLDTKSVDGAKFECTKCGYKIHVEINALGAIKKFGAVKDNLKSNTKYVYTKGPSEFAEGYDIIPKRFIDKSSDIKDLKVGDRIVYKKKISPRKMWEES